MIFLLLTLILSFLYYLRIFKGYKFSDDYDPTAFAFFFFPFNIAFIISVVIVIISIHTTNTLKAQNINMIPKVALQAVYDEKVIQLEKVKAQIEEAFDKNKFQVEIKSLNGVSLYSMPMSTNIVNATAGLGDIERGGAEKLKLLENLISRQYSLAEELVESKRLLNREDYYARNIQIMVLENSIFDGVLVKWLSIKNNSEMDIIENKVYFPK